MVPSPEGTGRLGAARRPERRLIPRSLRKQLTLQVWYRGGPEGSFIVSARGKTWRFVWDQNVGDVLKFIADGYPYENPNRAR